MQTRQYILVQEYKIPREQGFSRAIPSMCCLTLKIESFMEPHRDKGRIVVIGDNEDLYWK